MLKSDDNLKKLENYIAGELFKKGLEVILDDGVSSGPNGVDLGTFIVLFESSTGSIVSSTKKLKGKPEKDSSLGELYFEYKNDGAISGGTLNIDTIPSDYTKNYLIENETSKPDGFAIIVSKCKEEKVTFPDGHDENIVFPDLEDPYINIAIKGILSNKPIFSMGTKFQFNASSIVFGVVDG